MASPTCTPEYNASWALIIGIDSYTDPRFSPLGQAEADAQAVAGLLAGPPYDFTVRALLGPDATRTAILQALFELRATEPDDRVLVYFAGHGYTLTDRFGKETGYLAAADTVPEQDFTALELDEVTGLRRHAGAKHIAFIFDACYSGQALGLTRAPSVAADKFMLRRAYQAISAGAGDQPVADYQSMTDLLLEALRRGEVDRTGLYTLSNLGLYLRQTMAANSGQMQIPQFGHLHGSQGGDFLFHWEVGPRLPRELEMALDSEMGYMRWGAVASLIDIARGDDPDLASLAREWLERMAHDDPDERVRGAAQSFFDEEEALWLAEEDRIRQAEAEALLEEARRQQEEAARALREAERRAEEERQRLEAAERERQEALERARKAREIMPPSAPPKPTAEAPTQVTPLPTPPGRSIWLVTVIGWAIGGAIWGIGGAAISEASGWAIGAAIGLAFMFIGGAIGGLTTGLALRQVAPSTRWKQIGLVTLGWAIGLAFMFIGWAIGGLITGLALRQVEPSTRWKQVGLVTLGGAIGGAIALIGAFTGVTIGGDIGGTIGEAIGWAIGGAIGWAIGGAIGAGVTFWQLGRARRAKMNASSHQEL